jgi:hypothetical protein
MSLRHRALINAPSLAAWTISAQGSSSREPLAPFPARNSGFEEVSTVHIKKPSDGGFSLLVDDEILPVKESFDGLVWEWTPGFYAGEVTAELVKPNDEVIATYILDVSPDSKKLGAAVFQSMIDEVWQEDPFLVIGREPPTAPIGSLGREQNPLLEYSRLRCYGADFLHALWEVARNPIHVVRYRREAISMYRVRRADRRTALAALSNPDLANFLNRSSDSDSPPSDLTPTLDVPSYESDLDGAANRCLAALIQGVNRRAEALRLALGEMVQREEIGETRTSLAGRWAVRRTFLNHLSERLRRLMRQPPFAAVTQPEVSAAGLNAISAHPLYARAYGLGWRSIRHGVRAPTSEERLWISPTWEIFERWCFVRLGKLLRQACSNLDWRRSEQHESRAVSVWHANDNRGNKLELLFQPEFASGGDRRPHQFWSLSQLRVPDLVLTIESPSRASFIVLDAKYRQSRSAVLDAMTSAHVYHDALRWGDQKADLALLLVPASGGAPWLEDPAFHSREGVGVLVFPPDLPEGITSAVKEINRMVAFAEAWS